MNEQIGSEDIIIEETSNRNGNNENNKQYDTPINNIKEQQQEQQQEPQQETQQEQEHDSEQESPTPDSQNCKLSKLHKILIGIGICLLIVIAIVLILVLKKKKCNDPNGCPPNCTDPNGCSPTNCTNPNGCPDFCEINPFNCLINRKLYEVKKYNETINETTTIEFSNINNYFRRPDENLPKNEKIIKITYLFAIYDQINKTNERLYSAYAVILNYRETKNEDEISSGGFNILTETESKDDIPMIKFTFNDLGYIYELSYPKNINSIYLSYLTDFTTKIAPDLNNQNNNYERRLEINDNSIVINHLNNVSDGKTSLSDGTIDQKDIIQLSNKVPSKIVSTKEMKLFGNSSNQVDDIEMEGLLDYSDFENDKDNVREGLIKGLTVQFESSTELYSDEINEDISKKIKGLISNINFDNETNLRRLNDFDVEEEFNEVNNGNFEIPKIKSYKDLRKLIVAFKQPIQFSSGLFKTTKLGLKMALNAQVSFFAFNGTGIIKMVLVTDSKKINVLEEQIQTNFNTIAYDILDLVEKIAMELSNYNFFEFSEKLKNIDENLRGNLSELEKNLNNTSFISSVFDEDLNEIGKYLKENFYDEKYKHLINKHKETYNILQENKKKVDNKTLDSVKTIITESNTSFHEFYDNAINNIDNLKQNVYLFFSNMKEITDRIKDIDLDIDLYYGIKDELNIINNVYSQFIDNLKLAIENEESDFNNQTYQYFKEKMESNLKDIENIAQEMQFNDKVKEIINELLNNNEGKEIYSEFENYRNIIYNTLNSMILLVKKNNENELKENELNNTFTNLIKDIEEKQTQLFNALESYILFNLNFTLYVEDMECFFNIEREIYEKRKKGYIDYILKPIRELEDTFLTKNILNNIKNRFNEQFSKFKTLIKNNPNFDNLIMEFSNFLNIYNEIQNTYLGEEMVSKTIERFNNTNLLNNYINNFYKSVNDSYQKYESECYTNHFKKNLDKYISKPEEIINKIEQINQIQILEKNYSIGNITNIILNEIKYSIKDSYSKIQSIIENEYDKMFTEVPRSSFENYNEFNLISAFEEFFEEIKNIDYSNEFNVTSLSDDPFNIRLLNNNTETEFYYDFYRLTKQIKHDYAFRFCDGEDRYDYCPKYIKDNLLNEDQQYNSQISKARSVITQMKSTVLLSTKFLTNEKTLSNLNSSEYYENYKNLNNFKGDAIISDIISYVNKIDFQIEESLKPYINNFTNQINEVFTNNLNKELIKQIIMQNITSNIFIVNDNIYADFKKELSAIKSSIMRAFSNERNYYKNQKNYYSPSQSYYDSFDQLKNDIKNIGNNFGNLNISLNKELINEVENVFISRIDDITSEIKEKIKLTFDSHGTFKLFNSTLSISNYSFGVLDEKSDNLKKELKNLIEERYENALDGFKNKCQEIVDKQIDNVESFLEDEFEASTAELNKDVDLYSADETKEINSLFNSTKDNILDNYQKYLIKLNEVFNENNLMNQFNKLQNDSLNNLDKTINLDKFQYTLTEISTDLTDELKKSEMNENTNFKNEIQAIISKNFMNSLKSFVENKGNEYLEQIFYEDFILNFMSDLNFIKIIINNSHDYINLILQDRHIISDNFKTTLEEIYPYLKEEIKKNIIPKIDSIVLKKLNDFNIDVKTKILNGLKDNTIDMLKSIKIKLSDKILSLIPEQFTQSFLVSLNQSMDELFEINNFGEIKKSYKTNITNEIEQLSTILDNYEEEMKNLVITHGSNDEDILLIKKQLKDLIKLNKDFDNNLNYDLNDNIKESLILFINEINNCISDLLGNYTNNVINITKYLDDRLNEYGNSNFEDKINEKINKRNKLYEMEQIGRNINELLNSILIKDFSDFKNILEKNITKRNLLNNKRRLNEYNIETIDNIIQNYQKTINDFTEKFLKSNEFLSIFNRRIQFTYSFINNVESLYDYEIKFKNLLNNYAEEDKIKHYYTSLITIGVLQGRDFLLKANDYIEKSLVNLNKVFLKSLYSPIKYALKKIVDSILEEKFSLILEKVENKSYTKTDSFNELMKADTYMNNEICLFGICIHTSINLTQIDYSYGLNYDTEDEKYINVEVYLKSVIIGNIQQNISNLYYEKTNGTLANSSMHIIPKYNLVDQKTNLRTLASQYQGQYSILFINATNKFQENYSLVEVQNKSIEKIF